MNSLLDLYKISFIFLKLNVQITYQKLRCDTYQKLRCDNIAYILSIYNLSILNIFLKLNVQITYQKLRENVSITYGERCRRTDKLYLAIMGSQSEPIRRNM